MGDEAVMEARRSVGAGKTLNAANLETLGAARLAALLLEISTGNGAAQRRLRLALAGRAGPAEVAREVTKRLAAVARARTWLDAARIRVLVADLDAQRHAIRSVVAPDDRREAFELGWRLMCCAEHVFARSDDGSGRLAALFDGALRDLGPLAQAAALEPALLAERAVQVLRRDTHGLWRELVPVLASPLGDRGLRMMAALVEAWRDETGAIPPPKGGEHRTIGWANSERAVADWTETGRHRRATSDVLRQIAVALGDIDGYVAQFDAEARRSPATAADIARRLLEVGRSREALDALEAASASIGGCRDAGVEEWQQVRADALDALGQSSEAQAFRWACFTETLSVPHLRTHLRRLPAFDDFEAEERALSHALAYGDVHRALTFLIEWPDLTRAGELVLTRRTEFDGNLYEVLGPAAESLEAKHKLAATLLLRAMIDFTLSSERSSRYRHAARHWQSCARLATMIEDFAENPDHEAYGELLRQRHGRKRGFWREIEALC